MDPYPEDEKHGDSLNNLPPGYRFDPNSQELILHYLTPKITGIPLTVNPIHEVNNIYNYSPEDVTARFKAQGEKGKNKVWYFMTSRFKKYMNGRRPNRKAGNGYWKATGKEKEVRDPDNNNQLIGHQRSLVYHMYIANINNGIPQDDQDQEKKHVKTQWQMLELRVPDPPKPLLLNNKRKRPAHQQQQQQQHTMRLEGYVICRIYYKEKEKEKEAAAVADDAEEAAKEVTETAEEASTSRSSHDDQQEQQIITHNEQPLPLVVVNTTHNNQMISSELFNNITTTCANTYTPHITYTNTNSGGNAYIPDVIVNNNCSGLDISNINRSGAYISNITTNRSTGANITGNSNYEAAFGGDYSELFNNDTQFCYNNLVKLGYNNDDDIIKMINFDEVVVDTQTLMPLPELDHSKMDFPVPDFSHLVFPISTNIQ